MEPAKSLPVASSQLPKLRVRRTLLGKRRLRLMSRSPISARRGPKRPRPFGTNRCPQTIVHRIPLATKPSKLNRFRPLRAIAGAERFQMTRCIASPWNRPREMGSSRWKEYTEPNPLSTSFSAIPIMSVHPKSWERSSSQTPVGICPIPATRNNTSKGWRRL